MLSEEKRNMINPNGLYSHEIVSDWVYGNNKYWCHNWTFKPHIFDDGRVFMYDSYFDSWESSKEVTDENFDEWKFIFDFNDVKPIGYYNAQEYNEEDLYRNIATNSGGYTCSDCIWVKKTAQKNIDKEIDLAKRELNSAKNEVEWRERYLNDLLDKKSRLGG